MHDTCGVTSLHGIPGILSGICSVVIAAITGFPQYQNRYYPGFDFANMTS